MTPLRRTFFLLLALSLVLLESVLGRQAKENRRDFQKLNDGALDILANLAPAQWESVNEGHLQRMLIPRAGESPVLAPLTVQGASDLPMAWRKG